MFKSQINLHLSCNLVVTSVVTVQVFQTGDWMIIVFYELRFCESQISTTLTYQHNKQDYTNIIA
jgi:hypothetical protein